MSVPKDSEQWLLYGECWKCRKNKYCSKPCKKAEQRRFNEINNFIRERTGMGAIMDLLNTKLNKGGQDEEQRKI